MNIVIPDDYQDAVRTLDCYQKLTGHNVTIYHDFVRDEDTLASRFQDADVIVPIRERTLFPESLLKRLPKLKLIAQTGRGAAHVDIPAATRLGIPISVGGGLPWATAELTWALVMSAMRFIPQEVAALKAGKWQTTFGMGLRGKTLGIFGYGSIGSVVAGYAKAFGMNILVWGRKHSKAEAQAEGHQVATSQRDLFRQADVLCLHVKLTPETTGIVTATDLAEMKPSAVLVNTSRAKLIETGALENALRAGRPGYAAIDVYESEPISPDHPLLHMDNVICTPHLGYVEESGYEDYFGAAFDSIVAFAAGEYDKITFLNPDALKR
jgi:D-3-phosphoglycerate dehydrogenase / 2-oxoglutarate reductase